MNGRADVGTLSFAHEYDEDAVCTVCGFDGAEHAHWRSQTWEGLAGTPEQRRGPPCRPHPKPVADPAEDHPRHD